MDGRTLLARVFREATALGLVGWERIVLILVVALLLVLGKRGIDAVSRLALESPEPRAADPERDPSLPPARIVDGSGDPVGVGGPPEPADGMG